MLDENGACEAGPEGESRPRQAHMYAPCRARQPPLSGLCGARKLRPAKRPPYPPPRSPSQPDAWPQRAASIPGPSRRKAAPFAIWQRRAVPVRQPARAGRRGTGKKEEKKRTTLHVPIQRDGKARGGVSIAANNPASPLARARACQSVAVAQSPRGRTVRGTSGAYPTTSPPSSLPPFPNQTRCGLRP